MTDEAPARCEQCGNYLALCGHDLPFKERVKSVRVASSATPTRRQQ